MSKSDRESEIDRMSKRERECVTVRYYWLSDQMIRWISNWVSMWVIEWLREWLIAWLSDWLNDWLNDWLVEWLSKQLIVIKWVRVTERVRLTEWVRE